MQILTLFVTSYRRLAWTIISSLIANKRINWKPTKLFLAGLLFLVLGVGSVSGATIISAKTGNWNSTSTWSGGVVPTSADAVIIRGAFTVTVNITNAVCASLQIGGDPINGTNSGILTFATTGSPVLNVGGNVQVGGYGNTARTGTITFANGSTLNAGSVTLGNAGGTPAVGTIDMTYGGTLQTGSLAVGTAGDTWTYGTGTVIMDATNTLPATVFTTFNNLSTTTTGTTTTSTALNIDGNLSIGTGTTFVGGSYVHTVAGNWTNNGTFTAGTSTVTLNGNNAANINGSATTTFNNLTINKGAAATTVTNTTPAFAVTGNLLVTQGNLILQGTDNDYIINGNLTVSTTGTLTHSVNWDTSSKKIALGGNLAIAGNWAYTVRSHLQMTGSGKTISTGTSALDILTLATTGTITANGPVTVNDNFWVSYLTSGGVFATAGNTVTAKSSLLDQGTVTINGGTLNVTGGLLIGTSGRNGSVIFSSGTLNTDNVNIGDGTDTGTFSQSGGTTNVSNALLIYPSCSYTCTNSPLINLGGNWTNNGTYTKATETVTFNGSSAQTISGSTQTTYNNLVIANTNGGVSLNSPTTAAGNLTLTSGILTTTTTNLLSVTNTATTAISGGSSTSFINGPVNWALPSLGSGSTYNFPVGSGTTYLPFSLVNPITSGAATTQVQAFNTPPSGGSADGTTLGSISSTEYWSLATSGNFTNSSVSLTRPTAIAPLNTIGGSATAAGTYTDLGGTAGTNGVTGSNAIGTNRYFVLAKAIPPFWYKADAGVTTSNGSSVTQWNDQSGASNNATVSLGSGTITYADNTINFNPSLTFTNVYQQMVTSNTTNVKSFVIVTLPNISSSTTVHLGGLIGASSDNGIRLGATTSPYDWKGDQNTNDWTYYTVPQGTTNPQPTGSSWINGKPSTWNFSNWHIVTQTRSAALNSQYYLGGYFSGRTYYGNIAEVMAFTGAVPNQNSVETYLAIKYGITLSHDYIAGDGSTTVYTLSGYANNVAGLGNDATYGLNQKVAASINLPLGTSSRIVMATTNDFTSSNLAAGRTSLTNGQYLIWGDNGGSTSSWTTSGTHYIVSRTWKVQNTGSVGATNFQIDLTGYPISASGSYALLTATNSTFSSGITVVPLTNSSGNLYTAYITFPAGTSYFTITTTTNAAVYVRVGGYGTKDGTSWANAMATVQQAVETSNAMTAKPPVYVAAGDYYADPNYINTTNYKFTSGYWSGWYNAFLMHDGVNVYGAFPEFKNANNTNTNGIPADTTMRVPLSTNALYLTTLHGNTSQRVLGPPYTITNTYTVTGFTNPTKWDGFDLTGANISTNTGNGDDVCGGGVFTIPNSTISNCIIENNQVGSGSVGSPGSIGNDGAGAEMYGGTLQNCIVRNNNSVGTNSAGTINVHYGGSNVINCLVYNNFANMAGGGISFSNPASNCYFINNTICNNSNSTNNYASGINIFANSTYAFFYNNAVWGNIITSNRPSVSGVTKNNENYNAWQSDYTGQNTASIILSATNAATGGPYFVNTTTGSEDFRLQSNLSALWNKGGTNAQTTGSLVPTTDIRGVFRDAIPDIGCYELASRLYYVNNATGTDATGYGFNWSNPYKTVQFAITSPQYNQYDFPQVWVAKGTYTTSTPYLLQNNLSMYGGFAGSQATEFPTKLAMITSIRNSRNLKTNQAILSNTSAPIVNYSGTVTGALLDGFTITGATSGSAYAINFPSGADTIQNCKIINNTGITGGLNLSNSNVATNVLIADNSGIGLNFAGTSGKVVNATIANNTGVGINSSSSSPIVTNSIVWGNSANLGGSATPAITYSAASSNYGANPWSTGTGNIDLLQRSPNFKNPNNNYKPNRNYELLLISPCLGKGSVAANSLPIDANGKPRTYNSTIDMGAFEKWDGVTVNGSTVSNTRIGTTYASPYSALSSAAKDSLEICVQPNSTFNMGANTNLKTHWLELMQDSVSTDSPAQLTNGQIIADSVLYVRCFPKMLNGVSGLKGVWTFFGVPFNTATLNTLDGAVDENTVRIEGYSESSRADNGIGYAWYGGRLNTGSSMTAGIGYALSFNNKVPQNDIGQTVIFSSPSQVPFDETGTPSANITLSETPSATSGHPYWYDCGWNLIANPLLQPAVLSTMWNSSSSSYYGAVYVYKPYTDSYNVVPATNIIAATANTTIAPGQAFFVQTDVNGATTAFQSTSSGNPVLQSMAYVRPSSSNVSAAPVHPATFQFHLTGAGDYCNTYVIFDPRAHAAMEPMEDNPTMSGMSGTPALQLSTTATGSTTSLAINRLPFTDSTKEVPLQVFAPTAGSYTITMPESDTIANTVLLQDASGSLHDLTTGGYTFTTTTNGVTNNFTLIFGSTSTGIQVVKGITILQDHRNVTISSIPTMQQVAVYGAGGQIYYMQNPASNQLSLQLPSAPGVYLLKIITPEGVITKKMVSR